MKALAVDSLESERGRRENENWKKFLQSLARKLFQKRNLPSKWTREWWRQKPEKNFASFFFSFCCHPRLREKTSWQRGRGGGWKNVACGWNEKFAAKGIFVFTEKLLIQPFFLIVISIWITWNSRKGRKSASVWRRNASRFIIRRINVEWKNVPRLPSSTHSFTLHLRYLCCSPSTRLRSSHPSKSLPSS